ncbi:hypothetical protein [Enterococcus sp. DIV0756]|uniref:hypothetical protein n=1 Tax=Enterococcus sp. DIV0756 TaxID=2774636 RepID=UPI003F25EF37
MMVDFFKKGRLKLPSRPVKIYNLEISAGSAVSKKDLYLLNFFLNFFPNKEKLCCCIKTYSDDVFAHIYCQTSLEEWAQLNKDMVEITRFLAGHEYPEEALNLLDLPEDGSFNFSDEALIHAKAIDFINENRKDFQTKCTTKDSIYFDKNSDVNYFKIVWGLPSYMNFISENLG